MSLSIASGSDTWSQVIFIAFLCLSVVTAGLIFLLRRVASERSRYLEIASRANDGILFEDTEEGVVWANEAYCRMFGYKLEELVGRRPLEFALPEDETPSKEEIDSFWADVSPEQLGTHTRQNVRRNGERFWNQMTIGISNITRRGKPLIILVCRDVTEAVAQQNALKNANAQLERLVRTDPLTGIANRHGLDQLVEGHLAQGGVAVAQLDMDNFKEINDLHGHAAGDAALKHVAETLRSVCHGTVCPCRLGGDEFLVVAPDVELDDMTDLMRKFQRMLGRELPWKDTRLALSTSIGVAASDAMVETADDLLAYADFALYHAKRRGRGQISEYDPPLHAAYVDRRKLTTSLKADKTFEQLEVHLQPIVDASTLDPWGAEALLRWRHPQRGILPPGLFIDLARQSGLMRDMDIHSSQLALQALAQINARQAPPDRLNITINASPEVLLATSFLHQLCWACDRWDIDRSNVVVEVHETTVIEGHDGPVPRRIRQLTDAGFRVVLDDFGVGQAGLVHLSHLNITGLKLDRSLVDGIATTPASQSVVRAILALCRDLGLLVIAEGIERSDDLHALANFGCDLLQGYHIAKPMPLTETIEWFDKDPVPAQKNRKPAY